MKMLDRFILDFEPPTVTHQEQKIGVRNGKPYKYFPPELQEAKNQYIAYLAQHAPQSPYDGPISLIVEWYFHSLLKKGYKITKPDTDNLDKLLKDCMTETGFWKDDAQVAYETIIKKWTGEEHGCIVITILQIEGDDS